MRRADIPIFVIVGCHLIASFSVLGMSPYFATILKQSFGTQDRFWGGVFYAVPLLVMASVGPLWGAFADRFGKRISLARAQLGLAAALLLCGLAPTPWLFALCLALQGLFGGTFSASNALLTQYYRGKALARCLSWLQYSACLGLFAAPSALGALLSRLPNPQDAYLGLWLLPLGSFLAMTFLLPAPPEKPCGLDIAPATREAHGLPFAKLLGLEFGFTVATVLTYPYFVDYFCSGIGPEACSGVFFGIPHVVYLMLGFVVIQGACAQAALRRLVWAFALFSVAMLGHLLPVGLTGLAIARALLGIALVFAYVYLAQLVGQAVRPTSAGRAFGWLDTASKFAGVLAGLLAGTLVQQLGLAAPFALAAILGWGLTAVAWSLQTHGKIAKPCY